MSKQQLSLEIIIANYNSQFWLKKLLSSLKQQYLDKTKHAVQVTIVDNNSTDDSIKMINREFRWATVVRLPKNYGFAVANNAALSTSKAQYVMLLNSDVELDERSNLDILLEYLEKNPEVAVVTPKVVFTTGELDPACHRGEPTVWRSLAYFSGLSGMFPNSRWFAGYHMTYEDLNKTHLIDACSGAAMIVAAPAMEKVGLLDERFFMYAEDLDWCKRFRDAGYVVMYNPKSVVVHHKNKSGIKSSSQQLARKTRKYFYDTMLQYYDKHYLTAYPKIVRWLIKYFLVIKKGAL